MRRVIFWGLKFEACYFLGRPKLSSTEHPCPNLCRVPPPPPGRFRESEESIQFRISSLNHLPYFGTYICCRPAFIETVKKSEPLYR